MKLDLLNKEILDQYVRENFVRIKRTLESEQILSGFWRFFEVDVTQTGVKIPIKHNLSFVPRDIILLSKEGDQNLYFNYQDFDDTNIYVTTTNPCRVRFLAGSYKDKSYGGSRKEFTFFAPSLSSGQGGSGWFYGVGNPDNGLGSVGDFFLDTDNKGIYLKTETTTWSFQGSLGSSVPTTNIVEEIAVGVVANVWTFVPLLQINKVSDVTIFDNVNAEEVQIAWRIVGGGSQVEINSKKSITYTVRVEGFKI